MFSPVGRFCLRVASGRRHAYRPLSISPHFMSLLRLLIIWCRAYTTSKTVRPGRRFQGKRRRRHSSWHTMMVFWKNRHRTKRGPLPSDRVDNKSLLVWWLPLLITHRVCHVHPHVTGRCVQLFEQESHCNALCRYPSLSIPAQAIMNEWVMTGSIPLARFIGAATDRRTDWDELARRSSSSRRKETKWPGCERKRQTMCLWKWKLLHYSWIPAYQIWNNIATADRWLCHRKPHPRLRSIFNHVPLSILFVFKVCICFIL